MDNVLIGGTSTVGDNNDVEIRYSISTLGLSATVTFTQADYVAAIKSNGFDGVKLAILNKLQSDINALIPATTTATK
ncbi:hypothetical protein KBX31_10530 [Liquorilactobacillus satsumensis]|uniref:hypothetical protein n=1 Tax=Lactobacillaceae TaxID=33958 RepID=UPI0021C34463|nr:hypothetical protein [Liquorilactobacillus satsumensis]MCP9313704.1 hypothetical protein [Liquorilactobacillus satsumensis]MCP9360845.1 hypothetical protein [Liquorilactobacillus satsumensis]